MKKVIYPKEMFSILIIFIFLIAYKPLSAQVFNGDLALTTQAQVDFMALTNYTSITGRLFVGGTTITGSDITNVDGLSKITSVGLELTIFNNPLLTNINGFSNLTSVGFESPNPADGSLSIVENDILPNLSGLSNLAFIRGLLYIYDNDALVNIDGLSNVRNFTEFFQISGNPVLVNIDGLSGAFGGSRVIGGMSIFNNQSLTQINAISNILRVTGELHIKNNPLLPNLSALSTMNYAGEIEIENNATLTDFSGLNNIADLCGFFSYSISGNGADPPADLIARFEACLANTTPVADAGDDAEIIQGAVAQLDGSGSSDADSDPLSYTWSFVSKPNGSNAVLSANNIVNPSFTADLTGAYVLSLVVYDGYKNSLPDQVTLTAVTFQDAIEEPIAEVDQLPIGSGIKNSLKSKLQNALKSYNEGNINAAINQLNAFLNQLNNLVADGSVTLADAQPLIDYVNNLLAVLHSLQKGNFSIVPQIPEEFALSQNYPNPFNPSTKISYQVPVAGNVEIAIFNSLGEKVVDLLNEQKQAGYYEVEWNASNLPSGIYFYRMRAGEFTAIQKMILMK